MAVTQELKFGPVEFPPFIDREFDAGWSMGLSAQHIVLTHFRKLLGYREGVMRNEEVEAVHQLRVCARRCRTALQAFKYVWDPGTVQYFQKRLGKFANGFGVARDLDVMLIYLREQLEQAEGERAGAYRWLLEHNEQLREAEQPKLVKRLRKFEESGLARQFVSFFGTLPVDLWQPWEEQQVAG